MGSDLKTCPVAALRRWLEAAELTSGPVFRRVRRGGGVGSEALTGYAVALIAAVRAADAGLKGDFAGHSLRSGFATSAARAGSTERAIMRHGRWKDFASARRYYATARSGKRIRPRRLDYKSSNGYRLRIGWRAPYFKRRRKQLDVKQVIRAHYDALSPIAFWISALIKVQESRCCTRSLSIA